MDSTNQRWIWVPTKISYGSPPAASFLTYQDLYKYLSPTVPMLSPAGTIATKITDTTGTIYRHEVPRAILHGKYMWVFSYADSSKSLYNLVADHDLFPTIYAYNQTIYSPTSIARRSEEKMLMTTTIDFRNDTQSLRLGPYIIHSSLHYLMATRVPIANPISPCFPYGIGIERLDTPISEYIEHDSESVMEETVD